MISTSAPVFRAECPEDRPVQVQDLMAFNRRPGDLVFSGFMAVVALFFLVTFFSQTGWATRALPDDLITYFGRQFGILDGEGRLARFGKVLKQSWVGPMLCLLVLVPAALWNLRSSVRNHQWRRRFDQPTGIHHEIAQWLKALEFVVWFIAYTLLVPVLGYLVATLILGTALPWRMGYRGLGWFGITGATSFAIVVIFRSFLQIKTPVNIWLYEQLPQSAETFMKTWF